MKKIDDVEYFDVVEISERFLKKETEEEIKDLLEEGKINGKKIEDEWYADKEAIEYYIELFMNEKYCTIGPLEIDLAEVEMHGRILDLGGGGEGVIGQFKGHQVVAIDPAKRELEEAPESAALNIIMDAKDLKFIDNTFDSATAFFTMMYIPLTDHRKIFEEIFRILKKKGEFFLWDLVIPRNENDEKEVYIVLLKIKIHEKLIDSGYGIKWEKQQNANYFLQLGKNVGFEVLEQKIEDDIFYIKFKKP